MGPQLDGKVAIITGAGKGIGRAIAELFAREGARVVVTARSQAAVDPVVARIKDAGGDAIGLICDVSRRDHISDVIAATAAEWGQIDVLVNNAHDGHDIHEPILTISDEQLDRQFNSGVYGGLHFMQLCFPYLKESGGSVINFGSTAGVKGLANYGCYAAAREAMRALTRCAANEWGPFGITVNTICPVAGTETFHDPAINPNMARIAAGNPLGRVGTAEDDIAPVALFLAGAGAKYITGHTFMATGGSAMDAGR